MNGTRRGRQVTTMAAAKSRHTLSGGKIVGMTSINAGTGAAWYHTWHGTYIAVVCE